MAITYIGSTESNIVSDGTTTQTATFDIGTRTNGLLVVHIGTRSAGTHTVSGVTWNGTAMDYITVEGSNAGLYLRTTIAWLVAPTNGSNEFSYNTSANLSSTNVNMMPSWYDGALQTQASVKDQSTTGSNTTGDPSIGAITPTEDGELVVASFISEANAVLTIGGWATAELQNNDMGPAVTAVGYKIQTTAAAITATWTGVDDQWTGAIASFKAASTNVSPTIAPNTADGVSVSTTPTLEFTATDADGDSVEVEVEITDNPNGFASGSTLTDNYQTGSMLTIHPNPDSFETTWEGYIQVDDRPGQVFQADGGTLDNFQFSFGAHETLPEDTNGDYLVTIYDVDSGVRGDTVPAWVASTAYTVGQKVKNTSTANNVQQFLYVCTTAGTSGGTEPTWTEVEDATFNDGTVVWTAHRGAGPVNPVADPADTPTPGWIARSDVTAYTSAGGGGFHASPFSGANRIRLKPGSWYVGILDWRPANRTTSNTLTVSGHVGGTHAGNAYLDASAAANYGPRVGDDMQFKLYESFSLAQAASLTDSGFANTVTGADTHPFNQGEKLSYTVQTPLEPGVTYYWRARAIDPSGNNVWSGWTTTRSFTTAPGIAATPWSYAVTGTAATLTAARTLSAESGTFDHTGTAATLEYSGTGYIVDAEPGSYAMTGTAAALSVDMPAESGAFAQTGTDATLTAARTLSAESGTFAQTGTDAALVAGLVLGAESGTYAMTGTAAALVAGYVVAAEAGAVALTGTDAALVAGLSLAAESGSYAMAGTAAALTFDHVAVAEPGAVALTGTDASLVAGLSLVAEPGSLAMSGTDAAVSATRTLSAESGSYAMTGTDADLVTSSSLELFADVGAFAMTGTAADVLASWVMGADAASYAETGTPALLVALRALAADAGAIAVTGSDAGLVAAREVAAASGAYVVTGVDVDLSRNAVGIDAIPGSFAMFGTAAELQSARIMPVDAGAYTLTGTSAGLSLEIAAGSGAYALSGEAATLQATRALPVDAGAFIVTGVDASLAYSGASPTMTADPGSVALTGTAAALAHGYVVAAASGGFVITAPDADITSTSQRIDVDPGAFVMTGTNAYLFDQPRLGMAEVNVVGRIKATNVVSTRSYFNRAS